MISKKSPYKKHLTLLFAVLILLIMLITRHNGISSYTFDVDEIRSAWRSDGTPAQIISWQPTDWPPLYNLMLGVWQATVGGHPMLLRYTSLLIFLLAAAITFQVARHLFKDDHLALSTMLIFSAFGYSIFLSTYLRAYVVGLCFFTLTFLFTHRYFKRPNVINSLLVSAGLLAMMYLSYTSVFPLLLLGLYTLMLGKPLRIIRLWIPPIVTSLILYIPEILRRYQSFAERIDTAGDLTPNLLPFPEAYLLNLREFVGPYHVVWGILALIALVMIVINRKRAKPIHYWAWITTITAPLVLYVMVSVALYYHFVPRYSWWTLFTMALVFSTGLAFLPRPAWIVAQVVIAAMMFAPPDSINYRYTPIPSEPTFRWLHDKAQQGDVLYIDNLICYYQCEQTVNEHTFKYYYDFFGEKLTVVDDPADHRRVWYLSRDGWSDPAVKEQLMHGRVAGEFFGPWDYLVRMYEAPPDPEGVVFENGLRFHGLEIIGDDGKAIKAPPTLHEQTDVRVRMWWSVDEPIDQEYSIGLKFGTDDRFAAQDGAPQLIHLTPSDTSPLPTSMTQWQPGALYIDERVLTLAPHKGLLLVNLNLTVYQWWDGQRLYAEGVDEEMLLPVHEAIIIGWSK